MAVRHPKEVAEAARVGGHTDLVEAAFALAERRHWTEADCQRHKDMGFAEGWGACADQLVALAEA